MTSAEAFRDRLRAGAPLLGCFVRTPSPLVVEVLGSAGLDCLCLDAEHGPWDRSALDAALMAARAAGTPALVRAPASESWQMLQALDLGAAGVVVPHVRSAEAARAIVRACRYGPGGRGFAGGLRATGYAASSIAERLAQAARETSVIVQIEDAEALPEAGAIAAVDGVDAVFIGRIDLTVALGETDPKAPAVIEAVRAATAACRAAGTTVGMFTPDFSEIPDWRAQGATLFLLGTDHGFLRAGAQTLRADTGL